MPFEFTGFRFAARFSITKTKNVAADTRFMCSVRQTTCHRNSSCLQEKLGSFPELAPMISEAAGSSKIVFDKLPRSGWPDLQESRLFSVVSGLAAGDSGGVRVDRSVTYKTNSHGEDEGQMVMAKTTSTMKKNAAK